MQTRGKSTKALRHSGGVVREIEIIAINDALQASGLPYSYGLVRNLHQFLKDRIVAIDAAPITLRDNKELENIEKAAKKLQAAISECKVWGDVQLSVYDRFLELGWHYDDQAMVRWLLILERMQEQLFEPYKPSDDYHSTIRKIRDLIAVSRGNVSVHETSAMVSFFQMIENNYPGLIYPPDTVESGRTDFVRRALGKKL